MSAPIFSTTLDVRWGDLDALGHVNNATYATYVEEARLRWFGGLGDAWGNAAAYPVVVAQTVNYRRALEWPATVTITLKPERVGNTSVTVAFAIAVADQVYADGTTVLVWVGASDTRPVPLPDGVRAACADGQPKPSFN